MLKTPFTLRGDHLYCPLALGLDLYYGCSYDCTYCFTLGLVDTWGRERGIEPLDVAQFNKCVARVGTKKPYSTGVNEAIRLRKTIRIGNKFDPFPPEEHRDMEMERHVFSTLRNMGWSFKLETKNPAKAQVHIDILKDCDMILTATISPGLDDDWEKFEGKSTESPSDRLRSLSYFKEDGFQVGIVGEPFIPGYHNLAHIRELFKVLKDFGITHYNTYNLHLTPFVAKRLAEVPGLDIEKVWEYNQDGTWKKILGKIIRLAETNGIALGCPDFVNSGPYIEKTNTCCGVDVPNPLTYNFPTFKRKILEGEATNLDALQELYEGVGDRLTKEEIFTGGGKSYNLGDCEIKCSRRGSVKWDITNSEKK